jgi:hypothetical protein
LTTTSPPRTGETNRAKHPFLHWLPWLLPLLAIALPMVVFSVAASVPVAKLRWGEAATSIGRGDFLIPVLILCLEALRHWWTETKCGRMLKIIRLIFSILCSGAVIIGFAAFVVASSETVTAASTRSIEVITLGCFTVSLVAGTIAVAMSTPKAGA